MYLFYKHFIQTARNSRLMETNNFIQHGSTSCLLHTVAVAFLSIRISEIMNININKKDLIRGALLHDYFLYDWHDGKKERRIHGFTHPNAALKNAMEDFELTECERDIIQKHMFPLTPTPPKFKESIIVCIADKICSLYETFNRNNAYLPLRQVIDKRA